MIGVANTEPIALSAVEGALQRVPVTRDRAGNEHEPRTRITKAARLAGRSLLAPQSFDKTAVSQFREKTGIVEILRLCGSCLWHSLSNQP